MTVSTAFKSLSTLPNRGQLALMTSDNSPKVV
jgi:hypothetical protein